MRRAAALLVSCLTMLVCLTARAQVGVGPVALPIPWTPATEPGLVLDLNADLGVTGSGATLAWADQSGLGNNAAYAAATITAGTGGLNGHSYLSFAPGKMTITEATSLKPTAPPLVVWVMFTAQAAFPAYAMLFANTNGGPNNGWGFVSATANQTLFGASFGPYISSALAIASGSSYSLVGTFGPAVAPKVGMYSSGVLTGSTVSGPGSLGYASSAITIGESAGFGSVTAYYYRIVAFTSLSETGGYATLAARIANYSKSTYGL